MGRTPYPMGTRRGLGPRPGGSPSQPPSGSLPREGAGRAGCPLGRALGLCLFLAIEASPSTPLCCGDTQSPLPGAKFRHQTHITLSQGRGESGSG